MLVVRDCLAINLNNCTDFYCEPDTNKIIFCMNMLSEQGSCSYWNELEYSTQKEMLDDFHEIVRFYSQNERVCEL
jgi:hypothetical protein